MSLSRRLKFDSSKGLELILYVANRIANNHLYWVLKAPYFADKYNLEEAGRPVSSDTYYAMKDGPVPGGLYDIVKDVRDRRVKSDNYQAAHAAFRVQGKKIVPLRDAQLNFFSKTELDSLERAIKEIGLLPFDSLRNRSHDAAYDSADPNGEMALEAIVKTLPDGELILDS